jgi:hypothetical protein
MEITILEKDGQIAAIGNMMIEEAPIGTPEGLVGIYDKRLPGNFTRQAFGTQDETRKNYADAIRTSRNRGWQIAYRGRQLNNPATS